MIMETITSEDVFEIKGDGQTIFYAEFLDGDLRVEGVLKQRELSGSLVFQFISWLAARMHEWDCCDRAYTEGQGM